MLSRLSTGNTLEVSSLEKRKRQTVRSDDRDIEVEDPSSGELDIGEPEIDQAFLVLGLRIFQSLATADERIIVVGPSLA